MAEKGEWQKVGEFTSTEPLGEKSMRFDLKQACKGRYLRLTLLEGFSEGNSQSLSSGAACIAEFKVGKNKRK